MLGAVQLGNINDRAENIKSVIYSVLKLSVALREYLKNLGGNKMS
jgi:hypothetical protein